jgi:hypothetical protein
MRLLVASAISVLWAFSTAGTLVFEDTAAYIGETATICGVVVSAEYEPNDQLPRSPRAVSGSV